MIRVTYPTSGDRGEYTGRDVVGYFNSGKEARMALQGLCPWDFNTMWGPGHYASFTFEDTPGKLTAKDAKFINETKESIAKAKKHAKQWEGRGYHTRSPKNWGEKE